MTDPAEPPRDDPGGSLLLGALSLDIYRPDGPTLPGGGVLNMAWHLGRLGRPCSVLTRIGSDHPRLFLDFLERHRIPYAQDSIVAPGPSASIDIEIQADRQPWMDHFVDGVWSDYRATASERSAIAGARRLHAVLVEPVIAELERLHADAALDHLELSADFLGFRHYTVDRFADTLRFVDVGLVGWPGAPSDPEVSRLAEIARERRRRLVVTFGSRGVLVVDGRDGDRDRIIPVVPVEVEGTTIGCGDAFAAWFLGEYWSSGDLVTAVEQGKIGGAMTTAWDRPLPDDAYGDLLPISG